MGLRKIGDMSDLLKTLMSFGRGDSKMAFDEKALKKKRTIRVRTDKWARAFTHVEHATRQVRRERYQGCFSRQNLRADLRKDAIKELRSKHGIQNSHGAVNYEIEGVNKGGKLIRRMGMALGNRRYREALWNS